LIDRSEIDHRGIGILYLHAGAELYGADRILLELVSGIDSGRFRPVVVLPNHGPLVDELLGHGIGVEVFPLGVLRRRYFSPFGLANRMLGMVRALIRLREIGDEYHIDLVHTNTTTVLVGGIFAWMARLPHVWHIHEITRKPEWMAGILSFFVCRMSSVVIAVSRAVKKHLSHNSSKCHGKVQVIYNGISPVEFGKEQGCWVRKKLGIHEEMVLVGMVGRVNWWKGQNKLVDAAKLVLERHKKVHFLLVGGTFSGEENLFDELKQRIETEGLDEKVRVWGFMRNVYDVHAALDVFILPSMEPDPFPTVVLEAMLAKKPVVGFRHGGIVEMVEDGKSGFLCDVGSSEDLAERIERLLVDRPLRRRMGTTGYQRVIDWFGKERFIGKFEVLYGNLVAKKICR
jgi:glycosyltransferase involved in cell wall biosynthesis